MDQGSEGTGLGVLGFPLSEWRLYGYAGNVRNTDQPGLICSG